MDAVVEHLKELTPDGDVGASQATEEGRLQLHCQLCGVEGFISAGERESPYKN